MEQSPTTIRELIRKHKLEYPFVVRKVSPTTTNKSRSDGCVVTVHLPVESFVTITRLLYHECYPNSPDQVVYRGYLGNQRFDIADTEVWEFAERLEDNIVSLDKFRNKKRK